jgi:hypothetical protein
MLAWNTCKDDPCRVTLHDTIEKAVKVASPNLERAMVQLVADRVTAGQIQASITFFKSPAGQSILMAEDNMTEASAALGHTFAQNVNESVRRTFCSSPEGAQACSRMAIIYLS